MKNFKELADEKIESMKTRILNCNDLALRYKDTDKVVFHALVALSDQYWRLTELSSIPFDDRPPLLMHLEERTLDSLLAILVMRVNRIYKRLKKEQGK